MTHRDSAPVLLWFRQDLRVADQAALLAAVASGRPVLHVYVLPAYVLPAYVLPVYVLPVYVLDDDTPGPWAPGAASRWWLHSFLSALAAELERRGATLRRGRAAVVLAALVAETGAVAVHAGRGDAPADVAAEAELRTALASGGAGLHLHLHLHRTATQGQTFDPAGAYVRRRVPELARLPDRAVHAPWTASAAVLSVAGVRLGSTCPPPVVPLDRGRDLGAFRDTVRGKAVAA